jgi:nucleoside 2-deoxyribosyltransferase/predicted house-cleaning noncanonical NTP pyrophosphatase (MazG superfamily)
MARLYLAGPLFNLQDRLLLERLAGALEKAGHSTFLPHRDAGDDAASRGPEDAGDADARRQRVFEADLQGLARCDGVLALLDGPDVDAGTAFELGWAFAHERPIMGMRTDFRTLGPEGPVSLMVYAACRPFLHADGLQWEEIEAKVLDWAGSVNPWGGRLVRDGVPQMLKKRDVGLAFRKVPEQELPRALKAKMHELARTLESTKVEGEPEAVADLLQATETLIQKRGWDRSTLRALKQRRWKERGGYEEGWVVEDASVVEAEKQAEN